MANIESIPQFKSPESKDKISDIEREVFDLIVPGHNDSAIQPRDFGDRYPVRDIEHDLAAVEITKSQFIDENPERHKRATILEAIFAEQIELGDWGGKDAMTITPSEYDEKYHGVDIVIEFEEEKEGKFQYLTMGIDVTSSAIAVEKKLRKIKKGIRTGKLTKMKYFSSERNPSPDFPGPLKQLTKVVIGADTRTIVELSEIWLQIFKAKEMKSKEKDPGTQVLYATDIKTAKDKLASHRVQVLILKELEKQLETFHVFAKRIGRTEIAQKYLDLLNLVREILKTKAISKDADKINGADDVYRAIERGLANFDLL